MAAGIGLERAHNFDDLARRLKKWGFKVSHHLSFQRVRRGKNSTLDNSCAISLTTSLQRHSANPWLSSFKSLAPSNRDGIELLVKRTFASPIVRVQSTLVPAPPYLR